MARAATGGVHYIAHHVRSSFAVLTGLWVTWPVMQGVRGIDRATVMRSILPWQIGSSFFLYGLIAGLSYAVRGAWFAAS
jgi:hypothetical protein